MSLKDKLLFRIEKYSDHLRKTQGLVLDVGCGDGMVIRRLRRDGVRAIGIDIAQGEWSGLPVVVGDGYNLPFGDSCFDAVGSFTVLEHSLKPYALIKEMVRVLKPQGRIVISCPNMRGVFMLHPGHFVTHRGGLRQRIINLMVYLKTFFRALTFKQDIPFEIMPLPDMTKIPEGASDYNAVCATNHVTIKHALRRLGFRIISISAGMEYPQSVVKRALIVIIDKIPILRELFGGIFIVAEKR